MYFFQICQIVVPYHKIVHIADISYHAVFIFYKMVEYCQIMIGEILAAAVGMIGFMGIVTATLYWGLRPSDTKFFGALLLLAGLVWRRASKASFLVTPGEFEK